MSHASCRVLFPFLGGDTIGGSHMSALELVRGLVRGKYDPVVGVHQRGRFTTYLDEIGIGYLELPAITQALNAYTVKGVGRAVWGFRQLQLMHECMRLIRRNQIEMVHTHDKIMHGVWGKAARLAGANHILHLRTDFPSLYKGFDSRSLSARLFMKRPHRIITISKFCWQRLPQEWMPRATCIVNPFDTLAPMPDRTEAQRRLYHSVGREDAPLVVGFVGNLIARKRPHLFVEMAAILNGTRSQRLLFLIFGEEQEPVTTQVKGLIDQCGLKNCCMLMGPCFPIEPWMAAMDVLVAPAWEEPFGRILVEAMLMGTPVVASRSGGHIEIVQDQLTGLLVEPAEPQAYADAVRRILENPPFAQKTQHAARRWAVAHCSAEQHVKAVEQVYSDVLFGRTGEQRCGSG